MQALVRCGANDRSHLLRIHSSINHVTATLFDAAKTVPITYVEADGTEKEVQAKIGKNLMDVAHDYDVELEGMTRALFHSLRGKKGFFNRLLA